MIETVCPHCQRAVSFLDVLAGLSVKCPECKGFVKVVPHTSVPSLPAVEPPPVPIMRSAEPPTEAPAADAIASETSPPPLPLESADVNLDRKLDIRVKPWPGWALLTGPGIGVLILGVMALLAWALGGGPIWDAFVLILAGAMAVGTFAVLKELLSGLRQAPSKKGDVLASFLVILFGWGAWGVFYWVGSLLTTGTVHIENVSGQDVELRLDGELWQTSASGGTQTATVRRGRHEVTIRANDGQTLKTLDVKIEKRGVYVLNVLQGQTYYRGEVVYGRSFGIVTRDTRPMMLRDEWIDATKVDFLFKDPPQNIMVRRSKGMDVGIGEWRTYLTRGQPPRLPEEK
jgi:hypothetical protein